MSCQILSFLLVSLSLWSFAFAASPGPALVNAKSDAEARGFVFEASRDEIVARARKEGKIRVLSSLDPKAYPHLIQAFKKQYPFLDVYVEEIGGADSSQRFVLELKAGRVKDWDVMHVSGDFYNEYEGHKKNFDILGMASHGVLQIPMGMMDRENRNVVFSTSVFSVVAYHKNLISPDKVPDRWEDFLKPEFKGKKFVVEIRGGVKDLVAMIPVWGLERVLQYARGLADQQPAWTVGYTRILGSMTMGEVSLAHMVNWHTVVRAQQKDPKGSLGYKILEPVPVRLTVSDAVVKTALHPYGGLLWLEFLCSSEGQAIIDQYEPLKSNPYAPGSEVAKALAGKKVSVFTPQEADKVPPLMHKVTAALGFPKVESK